ncbi:MAG: hypothetical protein HY047_11580 [Acidobacteria bacterium]|nr:hypothetical protein [Acidobacteriota bacterium]
MLAIAFFGVVLVRAFDARARPRVDRLAQTLSARTAIERELPKMAGAELTAVSIDTRQRAAVRDAIEEAFVSAFRLVMICTAALALAAAAIGAAIR